MSKADVNKRTFIKLARESKSISDLARKLGYPRYYSGDRISGTAFREIKRKYEEYRLRYPTRCIGKHDTVLPDAVRQSHSIAEVVKRLKLSSNSGGMISKVKQRIKFLGLDTSHFTGSSWSKGKTQFDDSRLRKQAEKLGCPWEQAFKKGSRINRNVLMKRLLLAGKRKYQCAICKLSQWRDKSIRLRLDHIDGNHLNNEEANLRFLCPNCDSQTETFCRGTKQKSKQVGWWEKLSGGIPILVEDADLESVSWEFESPSPHRIAEASAFERAGSTPVVRSMEMKELVVRIKKLRLLAGPRYLGLFHAKRFLEECQYDVDKAFKLARQRQMTKIL